MKPLNFKNILPFAAAVVGIGGAFATTSMQSVSKVDPKSGFTRDNQNQCASVPVSCDDTPRPELCRVSGTTGAIAYDQEEGNICVEPLYRPF